MTELHDLVAGSWLALVFVGTFFAVTWWVFFARW